MSVLKRCVRSSNAFIFLISIRKYRKSMIILIKYLNKLLHLDGYLCRKCIYLGLMKATATTRFILNLHRKNLNQIVIHPDSKKVLFG